jgi:hypothetical protein
MLWLLQRNILRDRRRSMPACPACWPIRDKCTVRKNYFVLGRLEQPRQDQNLLYCHDEPSKPTKEGPLSYVLLESPFVSVSAVSRGHPSLVSLVYLVRNLLRSWLPRPLQHFTTSMIYNMPALPFIYVQTERCCYIMVDTAKATSQNGCCSYKLSLDKKT